MKSNIELAIDSLNQAFAADPKAISALLSHRVACNGALADHPTVQVGEDNGHITLGSLGLLNGAIEPLTGHRIAAIYQDGELRGFTRYQTSPTP